MAEPVIRNTGNLEIVKEKMIASGLTALIIPSNDPHFSEYVAAHWKTREWVSGFSGSAGTAVITTGISGLWTDSRYFLQAGEELQGSGFILFKGGMPGVPDPERWLETTLQPGDSVGIDSRLIGTGHAVQLRNRLLARGISLVLTSDIPGQAWDERLGMPEYKIYDFPVTFAGKDRRTKINEIREEMKIQGAGVHLVSTLDDIAWTLNLRGADVEFNPVFYAYLAIGMEETVLFIDPEKVDEGLRNVLETDGVRLMGYDAVGEYFQSLEENTVLINADTSSAWLVEQIRSNSKLKTKNGKTISTLMKSIKNDTEIAHTRKTMEKDGVALLRLYRWIEENIDGGKINESYVGKKLIEFRKMGEHYVSESFPAIAGYKGNGAIVHYRPIEGKCAFLRKEGIFLLDSGGQYLDGTTDITRTTTFDAPAPAAKKAYTLVLKGHIDLATARVPRGTRGYHLDTYARKHLWKEGMNYGHGTGHGVGFFMNVHEGPQGIRGAHMGPATHEMLPGMITSNEPGYYEPGRFGIRIENLVLTKESSFEGYLEFETLTLFPIDTQLIEFGLLTRDEVEWLNNYHEEVYRRISPYLNEDEKAWLKDKCKVV